ncbi:unknown [Alistipes sp. CAG:29]|nr:unknown [Alistipes sp. CAG:29]
MRYGVYDLAHADAAAFRADRLADDRLVFDFVAGAEPFDPGLVRGGADPLGEQRERLFHVADDGHVGVYDLVDLGGVDLQVDYLGIRPETFGVARHAVVETHPHGDEQVALLVADVGAVVAVHAQHADILRRGGRHGRQPQQGRGDRYAALCEEGLQFFFGVSEHHALSRHQQRPLCGVDQPYRLGDALLGGRGCGDVAADGRQSFVAERGRPALGVLGDVHHHRARTPRTGDIERLGNRPGNVFGTLDLAVPFGYGLRDAHEVGFLEGVGAQQRRTHLSGHQYQRRGVHQRVGQSGHGVRRPRARGDQANPYAAADAGVALRGMYGALFMADKDVAQPVAVVEKRIVNGDDGSSGIPEKRVHTLAQERFEQGLRPCDTRAGLLSFGSGCRVRIHGVVRFYSSSTMRTAPLSAELTSLA